MDYLKRINVFIITSLFFVLVAINNTIHAIIIREYKTMAYLLAINLILASIFFICSKARNRNTSKIFGFILLFWSCYSILICKGNIVDYSLLITYSSMLLLKDFKIKLIPVSIIIIFVFIITSISMSLNKESIGRMVNNILLIAIMCIVHLKIYNKSYTENPDIKKLYNLTKLDMIILDSLFLPDPCLKTMQNYVLKKDIHCSKTYVKDRLQQFYDIFDIKSGGSRKTELVVRLVRLGYTP